MAEEVAAEGGETESKGSSKLLLIIIGVVVLLLLIVIGVLAFMLMSSNDKPEPTKEEKEIAEAVKTDEAAKAFQVEKEYFFSLDPFIVNLNDSNAKHYLKAVMEIEVRRQEILQELQQRTPQVRDIILFILMNKTYDDIVTNEGKANLKHEISVRINQILKTGVLETLYITDFIVQW